MNYQDKTKDELIKELKKLQMKYDALKISYEKDIAGTKLQAEALLTSEEHYKTLFNSIDEGFCIVEVIFDENEKPVDYRFLEINPSFQKQTGLIDAQGKRMRELKPEHEEHWFEIYGKITLTGQPFRFENRAEQLQRWYDVYAFRFGHPEKRQVAIIFNDITQRKQTEEEIKRSETLRSMLLDNLPFNALVLKKHTREIVATNKLALEAGAVIGKTCYETLTHCNYNCPFCRAPELWETGKEQQVEAEYIGKHWEGRWIPFSDDLYVHYIIDITERKQVEEELLRRNSALSKLNQIAVEISKLSFNDNFEAVITRSLKGITGADAAVFSEYNSENRTLSPGHIEIEHGMVGKIVRILGKRVKNVHSVVSDKMYREMTSGLIKRNTLYEVSFGAISHSAGAAIKDLLKVDRFIGVAYLLEGKLFGTTMLAMRKDQPDPPPEILENFINMVSLYLKRRNSEKELYESEERYHSLVENTDTGFIVTEANGIVLSANESYKKLAGFEVDEDIIGQSVLEWTAPEEKENFANAIALCLRQGFINDFETIYQHSSGRRLNIVVNATIHNLPDGFKQLIAYCRDITERKQAEEALSAQLVMFSSVLKNLPVGVWITDATGKIIRGNEAGQKIWEGARYVGIDRYDEYKGWWADTAKLIEAKEWAVARAFTQGETSLEEEIIIECFDGTHKTILNSALPLRNANQQITGAIIINQDITKRKLAEKALLLEKENFRHSLENSPLGVRIVSEEGNTIYANQALLDMYGYKSLKELQTTPLKERYTNKSYAEAQERKRKREGGDFLESTYEVIIVRKNGETAHLKVHRKKVLWDSIWQFQIVYEDITNSRIREKELEESHEQLAQLNLYLQKIKEEERRLIARELHDELGQALTSIKIDLGNLKMYTGDNKILKSRIEKTTELVSDSIGFVKRLTSELRPHILDDLGLISAIKWYTSEYEQRTGIQIRLAIDEKVSYEKNTELIIFRILQESLTNIARHSQAKNTIISLSESKKGKLIEIKDDGIGFSTSATKHGKSFGLLNMRERAKEIGGTLVVKSEPGYGTTIMLLLPGEK